MFLEINQSETRIALSTDQDEMSNLYQVTVHLAKQFQWVSEEFEDTKEVIQISVSQKNRKHNCQKKKIQNDKQWSTKHTYKTKDHRVTQIPLKTGMKSGDP